jgi:hypothetical protein
MSDEQHYNTEFIPMGKNEEMNRLDKRFLELQDLYIASINNQHRELRAQSVCTGIGIGAGLGIATVVLIQLARWAGVWSAAQI